MAVTAAHIFNLSIYFRLRCDAILVLVEAHHEPYLFLFHFISQRTAERQSKGFSCCFIVKCSVCFSALPCRCHEFDEPKGIWQSCDTIHNFACIVPSSHFQFYFIFFLCLCASAAVDDGGGIESKTISTRIECDTWIVFGSRRRWFTALSARFDCWIFGRKKQEDEDEIIPKRPIVRRFIYKRMNMEHARRARATITTSADIDRNGGRRWCVWLHTRCTCMNPV